MMDGVEYPVAVVDPEVIECEAVPIEREPTYRDFGLRAPISNPFADSAKMFASYTRAWERYK